MTRSRPGRGLTVLIIPLLLCACGYRPLLISGDRSEPLRVPMVTNSTAFAGMSSPLTGALRTRLASYGVEVVSGGQDAGELAVEILSVEERPGMLGVRDGRLISRDVLWRVELGVSMQDSSGEERIPYRRVAAEGRALATGGIAGEAASGEWTRSELVDTLAREVAALVLERL